MMCLLILIACKPTFVLINNPSEKLFVDFAGDKISYIDHHTGEIIYCQVFVVCLPYSDYSFAMAMPCQSIEDFLHALSCSLVYSSGVPKVLVPDNLKSAIVKDNRYASEENRTL